MPNMTQIVCLCEGKSGQSIDEVFINRLIRSLDPSWVRPWGGSNTIRLVPCGGRGALIKKTPQELKSCLKAGGITTLIVWADCDHDCIHGDALRDKFWKEAQKNGIGNHDFERVVFILAKDRLENWIEFLHTGGTDEATEGPRVKHNREAADAAKKLAEFCKSGKPLEGIPASLKWSCKNWRALVDRMK